MEQRGDYGKNQFIEYFTSRDVSKLVADEIWKILIPWHSIPNFKPQPSDDIPDIFGIVDEDFADLIFESIDKCKKLVPSQEERETMDQIATVEDLVLYVDSCKDQ